MEHSADQLTPAYVAGLLDGEGTITILMRTRSVREFTPTISITMAHEGVIAALHARYGGTLTVRQQKAHWAVQHRWVITSKAAIRALLQETLPFLLVKREQAFAMLDFLDARDAMRDRKARTEADRDDLEARREAIRSMNRKGARVAA